MADFKEIQIGADGQVYQVKDETARNNAGSGGYEPPEGGIPKTDLATAVQESLNLADSSLQPSDKTQLQGAITQLQNALNTLIGSGNVQGAIDTFNEVVAFLNGINSSDTLAAKLALKANASDLSNYATKSELGTKLSQSDVSVETQGDGTVDINVGSGANKDTYTINLNHTHEGMAKLELHTQATLPVTKELDTIYAQVDNVAVPTEVQRLFIGSAEFVAGAAETGEPQIVSPSNTVDIDMGYDTNGVFTKLINVKAKNISQAPLTVAVSSGTGYSLSYGQLTGQSSITIPAADALLGALVTVVCDASSSTNDEEEGTLVITSSELSGAYSANLVAQLVRKEAITAVKFTKQQYVETDINPGPNTRLEIDMKFDGELTAITSDTTNTLISSGSDSSYNPAKVFICNSNAESSTHPQFVIFSDNSESNKSFDFDVSLLRNRSTLIINNVSHQASYNGGSITIDNKQTTMPAKMKFCSNSSGIKCYGVLDVVIYSLKHYENDVLTHDYRPYIRNGVVGLYDTVTDTFISSATSTQLVAIN